MLSGSLLNANIEIVRVGKALYLFSCEGRQSRRTRTATQVLLQYFKFPQVSSVHYIISCPMNILHNITVSMWRHGTTRTMNI